MFKEEEKNYYKQIKAPNNLRARIQTIEVTKKHFNYRLALSLSMCIIFFVFSFNIFNQGLNLSLNGQEISGEAYALNTNQMMMYRISEPVLKIKTNRDVIINNCDGEANYANNIITWLIDKENVDATYSLYLSDQKRDYQVLITYDEQIDDYTITVHKLEKGAK